MTAQAPRTGLRFEPSQTCQCQSPILPHSNVSLSPKRTITLRDRDSMTEAQWTPGTFLDNVVAWTPEGARKQCQVVVPEHQEALGITPGSRDRGPHCMHHSLSPSLSGSGTVWVEEAVHMGVGSRTQEPLAKRIPRWRGYQSPSSAPSSSVALTNGTQCLSVSPPLRGSSSAFLTGSW